MNKVTMQDIADRLSVSRITVWKAMNNREGVSEELRDKILSTAKEMGYFRNTQMLVSDADAIPEKEAETVAVVVSRPESSTFWMQIIHHIAKELSLHNVNMMYTYLPTFYTPDYHLPSTFSSGELNGFIVLNVYDDAWLEHLSELSLPKVFLDTTPVMSDDRLNGDLMIIEGRSRVREITRLLLDRGLNSVGFIGDVEYAQTNEDRYKGYCDAFAERGKSIPEDLCMTSHLGLQTHYEELCAFLDGLEKLPEAFVCVSDYIAHFIVEYCIEKNIPLERMPILTGFDNSHEYGNVADRITTVDVDTIAVGSRLADKIIFAMHHPKAAHEVSYIKTQIVYRGALLDKK